MHPFHISVPKSSVYIERMEGGGSQSRTDLQWLWEDVLLWSSYCSPRDQTTRWSCSWKLIGSFIQSLPLKHWIVHWNCICCHITVCCVLLYDDQSIKHVMCVEEYLVQCHSWLGHIVCYLKECASWISTCRKCLVGRLWLKTGPYSSIVSNNLIKGI